MDKIKKFLKKLQPKWRDKLEQVMQDILTKNLSSYNIKRLGYKENLFRIRVFTYRIIFYMDDEQVKIVKMQKRGESTYKNL